MTDIDGSEGFSCTYAKKKVNDVLNDLIDFSDSDPKTALQVTDDIYKNVKRARQYVIERLYLQSQDSR